MTLGLGSQIAASLHDHHHHHPPGAAKYEHILPQSNPPIPSSSPFFMPDSNQAYQEQQHHGLLLGNKPFHGLMQFTDLQSNANTNANNNSPSSASAASNLFNLGGFFPINNSGTNSNNANNASGFLSSDQFNNGNAGGGGGGQGTASIFSPTMTDHQVGSGLSSLYSTSMQQESLAPHMSATALLQKAAQMGPTTSSNSSSLLRGLGGSSSSTKSDSQLLSASNFSNLRSHMDNDNHFQGLMNSLANGNSSIIFGASTSSSGHQPDNTFLGFNGRGMTLEHHKNASFSKVDEAKLHHQSLGVSMGGSDRLTLDFLGVGGMVRNVTAGFSQREQRHGSIDITSLDPEIKTAAVPQGSRPFAGSKLQ